MAQLGDDLDEIFNGGYSLADQGGLIEELLTNTGLWHPVWNSACSLENNGYRSQFSDITGSPIEPHTNFYLPGVPIGETTLREKKPWFPIVHRAGKHTLVKVNQGMMVKSPNLENPILYSGLSECSTIIGTDAENTYSAHISYSEEEPTLAVLKFLREREINPFVIVSESEKEGRIASKKAYEKLGVEPDRIIPFTCQFNNGTYEGATVVYATQNLAHKVSFDLDSNTNQSSNQRDRTTLAV